MRSNTTGHYIMESTVRYDKLLVEKKGGEFNGDGKTSGYNKSTTRPHKPALVSHPLTLD